MNQFQISFCTVCMNRLHHLKQTLTQNIQDNASYENLEFVVVDYNSTDGLEEWIKLYMQKYLETNRLKYYRTTEPVLFHRSHSRNLSFKLAVGEILCNVDADNYTGKDFAFYTNEQFNIGTDVFLTPIDFHKVMHNHYAPADTLGRVCFTKKAFFSIKGYSERMHTHGFQDYDFANRLELAGNKRIILEDPAFLKAITHDDNERIAHEFINGHLESIYFSYLTPSDSVIIFFYKNGTFEKGILRDNQRYKSNDYHYAFKEREFKYEYTLKESKWVAGRWEIINTNNAKLIYKNGAERLITIKPDKVTPITNNNQRAFYRVKDQSIIKQLIVFNTHYTNRNVMLNNWIKKRIITNKKAFGKAVVYKNFSNNVPIII